MRKSKFHGPFHEVFFQPYSDLWYGLWAGMVWGFEQYRHWHQSGFFAWVVFGRGILLLALAAGVYAVSQRHRKGFSFLGFFPLLWLSVSGFQWNLCAAGNRQVYWLVLFLTAEILVFSSRDGKKLLIPLFPIWALMSWLFLFSLFLPLSFLTAVSGRFKNSAWIRWGGLGLGILLFIFKKAWVSMGCGWEPLYEILIRDGFFAFFLLAWLGWAAFPKKGTDRHGGSLFFLMTLGFFLWAGLTEPPEMELFQWILVFFAGFGLESFRRDLMEPKWNGRLAWASLGIALFGGVF